MSKIFVEGGARLNGTVRTLGAKNAVLKEIVSTLLAPGRHHLTNGPAILDVELMARVLEHTGCQVDQGEHELWIVVPEDPLPEAPIELVRTGGSRRLTAASSDFFRIREMDVERGRLFGPQEDEAGLPVVQAAIDVSRHDVEESRRIIDAFIDRGGNFVDTANAYSTGAVEPKELFFAPIEAVKKLIARTGWTLADSLTDGLYERVQGMNPRNFLVRERLEAGPLPEDNVCTLRGVDVKRILATEFGVVRCLASIYHLLHRLGYSYLRPRPRHRRADPAAQRQFCRELPGRLAEIAAQHPGHRVRVYFEDESRFGQQGTTTVSFPSPKTGRFLRISQTMAMSGWWSLAEVDVTCQ